MFARSILVLSVIAILGLPVARAQEPQDAPDPADETPATQPATVPADTSTPQGTLKVLTTAMYEGDGPTMLSLILAETELEARMRDAQIELSQASATLRRSLVEMFGEEVLVELDGPAAVQQQHAAIDAADAEEHDGAARVTVGLDHYELKKIDGKWRLSLEQAAKALDARMLEQSLEEMSIRSEVYEEMALQVAEGRYESTDEVGQALQGKLMVAMMRQAAAKEPAATQEDR